MDPDGLVTVRRGALAAPQRVPRAGFTFVELLVAATMMSILFVGLASHLRGGLVVWQRATQTAEVIQHQRVAIEQLQRDVANAFLYDPDAEVWPAPSFEAQALSLFTVEPASRQSSQARVRYVTYQCATLEEQPGLWRKSRSIPEVIAGLEGTPQRLLPGCRSLALRYAYPPAAEGAPIEWRTVWEDLKTLPRLVEVTIELASGDPLRRVVFAPAGAFGKEPVL